MSCIVLPMEGYATLVLTEDHIPGALALAWSIRKYEKNQTRDVLVLLPRLAISREGICTLTNSPFVTRIVLVDGIPNPNTDLHQSSSKCRDVGNTKLRIWTLDLIGYDKIVYIDADCIVCKPIEELFDLDEKCILAATPDIFPPDHFNAGVLFIRPSSSLFGQMLVESAKVESYDGGDTGFLNHFFPDWWTDNSGRLVRLAFGFNCQRTMYYFTKTKPLYWSKAVRPHMRILHFSSTPKPWSFTFEQLRDRNDPLENLWQDAAKNEMSAPRDSFHLKSKVIELPNGNLSSKGLYRTIEFHGDCEFDHLRRGYWVENDLEALQTWKELFDELRFRDHNSSESEAPIPKILHQIWLSTSGDVPPEIAQACSLIQANLPDGWDYKLWNRDSIIDIPRLRPDILLSALPLVQQSDILRLEILYHFGGVYLDTDFSACNLSLLETILNLDASFLASHSNCKCIELSNAALASSPQHPTARLLLLSLNLSPQSSFILRDSGPGFLTRTLASLSKAALLSQKTAVLPSAVFHSLPNGMRALSSEAEVLMFAAETSVAVHRWKASWRTPSLPPLVTRRIEAFLQD